MRMELTLAPKLSMKMSLQQIVAVAGMMSLPVGALDRVLDAVASNPESAEATIKSSHSRSIDGQTRTILGGLSSSSPSPPPSSGSHGGIISSVKIDSLSEIIDDSQEVPIVADVRYFGRENEKPSLKFAKHLSERPSLSLVQIPSEFGDAKKLYRALIMYRDWIAGKLRDAYSVLGEVQREFIFNLDLRKLNIFIQSDLAEKLGVTGSTVSRLIAGRYVEIGTPEKADVTLAVSELMPTKNDVKRYQMVERINILLQEEAKRREAFSDDDIARRIGGGAIARRTVTKFRSLQGIPSSYVRNEEYAGDPSKSYQMSLTNVISSRDLERTIRQGYQEIKEAER